MKRLIQFISLATIITVSSGCNIIKVTGNNGPDQVGQELLNLHAAHEKNIIDDSEYERLTNRLLDMTHDTNDQLNHPKKDSETMIHVLASIQVKPGQREALIEIFKKNIPTVLAEDGCIQYALTVDTESGIEIQQKDDNMVTVVEKWESVEALQAHLAAPHMKQYSKDTEGMTEGVELKVLEDA